MITQSASVGSTQAPPAPGSALFRVAYRAFAYFGLFTIHGSLLYGFRHDAGAPPVNYAINAGFYAIFLVPHLLMTRSWLKQAVWGNPAGSPRERRVYITITIITWLAVIALQRFFPLPGPSWIPPEWLRFGGIVLFISCVFLFFQGATAGMIDGLLGVPGSVSAYAHGPETPLFTDGAYGGVRHPMYRAAVLGGLCSLLIHPNAAQAFWCVAIAATFIAFIPVEEAQLTRARGEDYRAYVQRTPWRLFRGVW